MHPTGTRGEPAGSAGGTKSPFKSRITGAFVFQIQYVHGAVSLALRACTGLVKVSHATGSEAQLRKAHRPQLSTNTYQLRQQRLMGGPLYVLYALKISSLDQNVCIELLFLSHNHVVFFMLALSIAARQ
jgi:hypothetical protein